MKLRSLCLIAAMVAMPANAKVLYTVTDLGTLGGSFSWATAINDLGQVTGASATVGDASYQAFLYSHGVMQDIGSSAGFANSVGRAINASGQIAGEGLPSSSPFFRAVLFSNNSSQIIPSVGGNFNVGYGINDTGAVAGFGSDAAENQLRSFVFANGTLTDIGSLGTGLSVAYDINNKGQVTGFSQIFPSTPPFAYLYNGGSLQNLGILPGDISSAGNALNDLGHVVGTSYGDPGLSQAFLHKDGVNISLGSINGWQSEGRSINNSGQIVGTLYYNEIVNVSGINLSFRRERSFVYDNGGISDLNYLIAPETGWTLNLATGINNSGQIVGTGLFQGKQRAFLLNPIKSAVPEPATWAFMILGFGMIGSAMRRRAVTLRYS